MPIEPPEQRNPASPTIIEFKSGTDKEQEYRDRIVRVRRGGVEALKSQTPRGTVEVNPAIQSSNMPFSRAPSPLSTETQAQLNEALKVQQANETKKITLDEEALKKEVEEKKEDLFKDFDFSEQNEAEAVLNNKKRRKTIEDRCEPMSIDDLIMKNEVQQLVPILPGKFEVVFRSLTPEENLFIKQFIAKDTSSSEAFALEKYGLCQLTCALVSLNGRAFVEHRGKDGVPQEDLFNIKLKVITKMSGYVIADIGINYMWFDIRVRKLLNPDSLGNG